MRPLLPLLLLTACATAPTREPSSASIARAAILAPDDYMETLRVHALWREAQAEHSEYAGRSTAAMLRACGFDARRIYEDILLRHVPRMEPPRPDVADLTIALLDCYLAAVRPIADEIAREVDTGPTDISDVVDCWRMEQAEVNYLCAVDAAIAGLSCDRELRELLGPPNNGIAYLRPVKIRPVSFWF